MRRTVLAFFLSVIIIIISVVILVECGRTYGPPVHAKGQIALPRATPLQPVGESAITPTSNNIPAFTKDDVIQYVKTHDVLFSDTPPSAITAIDVSFITSQEVNKIINRQGTGIPDNYLLCFVRLTGTFIFSGPPTLSGKPTSSTFGQAFEVFDAKTGNLLMAGALGKPISGAAR